MLQKRSLLESFFNNVAGLGNFKFIKKRLQSRCFPVKFAKFLRATIFTKALNYNTNRNNMEEIPL